MSTLFKLAVACTFACNAVSAQNTFPTTGNVGIGTDTPNKLLHVAGAARLANLGIFQQGPGSNPEITTDGGSVLRLKGQLGTVLGKLNVNYDWNNESVAIGNGNSRSRILSLYNSSDSMVMQVTNTGSVGIGTATPNKLLHVAGTARLANLAIFQQGLGSNPEFTSDGSSLIRIKGQRGTILGKLNIFFDYANESVAIGNGDSRSRVLSLYNSSDAMVMSVTNPGNVGIGIADPSEKLCVNGNILSKKVKVTATGWPDYVFHPSYRLMPLEQLEQYIKTHRHLPEVVSAAEVERDGLDLGDNQAALLKKIEELTLYVIELKKLLDEQGKKIQLLESNK